MKFELEPDNRNCPDEVLLDDLRRVAAEAGRTSVTKAEYDAKGRFNGFTLVKRFGSWNKALERGGLENPNLKNIPKEALLADLKRVAARLESGSVSRLDYNLHGNFSVSSFLRGFGSWKRALLAAGLTVSPYYRERATEDQLLANLGRVWEQLGRQPRSTEMARPLSSFSRDAYQARFGSFRKALEAFVASIADARSLDAATTTAAPTTTAPPGYCFRHKTSRHISWRLKFLVMRRDNFKCCITGRSPATEPGVNLEVDHIIPWDKGGETVMDNLQTLCREINIGKSNLDMHGGGERGDGANT